MIPIGPAKLESAINDHRTRIKAIVIEAKTKLLAVSTLR